MLRLVRRDHLVSPIVRLLRVASISQVRELPDSRL